MSHVRISNLKIKGLEPVDFYRNREYKLFAIGDGTSTLVPFYKELLKDILGDKIKESFQDLDLSKEQTEQIKQQFSEQIDLHIPKIENKLPYNQFIDWKGKKYEMNLSLYCPVNRKIWNFYSIVQIADECLKENKPMYLSLD